MGFDRFGKSCFIQSWLHNPWFLISEQYPLSPPTVCKCYFCHFRFFYPSAVSTFFLLFQVRFLTPVFHVNIDQTTGQVCLGFISADNWNPTNGIEDVLRGIFSLLITPQVETAQDQQILGIFQDSPRIYERKARQSARKYSWTILPFKLLNKEGFAILDEKITPLCNWCLFYM